MDLVPRKSDGQILEVKFQASPCSLGSQVVGNPAKQKGRPFHYNQVISENPLLGPLRVFTEDLSGILSFKKDPNTSNTCKLFRGWSQSIIIRKWYSMVFQYMYIILYYNLSIFYIYFKLFVFCGMYFAVVYLYTYSNKPNHPVLHIQLLRWKTHFSLPLHDILRAQGSKLMDIPSLQMDF